MDRARRRPLRIAMVFSSATFLFYFLPAFLLLYYLLPWKNTVLLLGSLVFYAWGEPRFVPLLMGSALLNYSAGYLIARASAWKKHLLGLGIGANLAILFYYKYIAFFADILNALLPRDHQLTLPAIVLPLGISFFTFQGISYLVDVYRNEVDAQKSFWRFAMYKAMFPQLIAGPIVRYKQIANEIEERAPSNARVWAGLNQFIVGLAQKVLIANTVALPADRIFATAADQLSTTGAWLGIACYTIQILYDFAGYSNMAIGIGHMLGFSYPPNFKQPYSSTSVTEFWRRWHISLSSWFRDYLYIPLGGNRGSPARTYLNLAIVFLLCGLWHGAAWTFVVWGGWHGALLVMERMGLGLLLARLPAAVAQAYTLFAVMIGWVFFRADSIPHAIDFLGVLFGQASNSAIVRPWQMDVDAAAGVALIIGAALSLRRIPNEIRPTVFSPLLKAATAVTTVIVCVASLAAGTYNPFIYFRF
jgi:alginate O-acetyltransferase complex protein AlgI